MNKMLVLVVPVLLVLLTSNLALDQRQGARGDMQSIFTSMDKNQDGKISKTEFGAIWRDQATADQNFTFFDKNHDDVITSDEFISPMEAWGKRGQKQ